MNLMMMMMIIMLMMTMIKMMAMTVPMTFSLEKICRHSGRRGTHCMPGIFTAPNWFKRRVINVKTIVRTLGLDDNDDIGRFGVKDDKFNLG